MSNRKQSRAWLIEIQWFKHDGRRFMGNVSCRKSELLSQRSFHPSVKPLKSLSLRIS